MSPTTPTREETMRRLHLCPCGDETYRPPKFMGRRMARRCAGCDRITGRCTCPVAVVHACPPRGSGTMPCCGATPFERMADRMTLYPELVTCPS